MKLYLRFINRQRWPLILFFLGWCNLCFGQQSFDVQITINPHLEGSTPLNFIRNNPSNPTINAVVGDAIQIKVKGKKGEKAKLKLIGLPDVWFTPWARETVFMSSKSVVPGHLKPWVGFYATPHVAVARRYGDDWAHYVDQQQPQAWKYKYDDWQFTPDDVSCTGINCNGVWTFNYVLQRVMNSSITDYSKPENGNEKKIPYYDNKLNENPEASNTKQRQGKIVGQIMNTLAALDNKIEAKYPDQKIFSNQDRYLSLNDKDEYLSFNWLPGELSKDHNPKNLYNLPIELWKEIPEDESPNPMIDVISWYQRKKSVMDVSVTNLTTDYKYDGYEIWEGLGNDKSQTNPRSVLNEETTIVSAAPGKMSIGNGYEIPITIDVKSVISSQKFYNIKGNNVIWNKKVPATNLTISDYDPSAIRDATKAKFKLMAVSHDVAHQSSINAYSLTASGGKLKIPGATETLDFQVTQPISFVLTYQQDPDVPPVIVGGKDMWIARIGAARSKKYNNVQDPRTLTKPIYEFSKKVKTTLHEYHTSGTEPEKFVKNSAVLPFDNQINALYTIENGETLEFSAFDGPDFALQTPNEGWYYSKRLNAYRVRCEDIKNILLWKLYKIDPVQEDATPTLVKTWQNSKEMSNNKLTFSLKANFSQGEQLAYYVLTVDAVDSNKGRVAVLLVVRNESDAIANKKTGIAKIRSLSAKEKTWLGLPASSTHKLAFVTHVLSEYTYNEGPRAYDGNHNGMIGPISRESPYNDYADHYKFRLNNSAISKTNMNSNSVPSTYWTDEPKLHKLLATAQGGSEIGYWYYHLDPDKDKGKRAGFIKYFDMPKTNITQAVIGKMFTDAGSAGASNTRKIVPWEVRMPIGSISKYHGFRWRHDPKLAIDLDAYENAILNGNTVYPANYTNTVRSPAAVSFLSTEEQMLRYRFYLALKHNRIAIVPESTETISFLHDKPDGTELKVIAQSSHDLMASLTGTSAPNEKRVLLQMGSSVVNKYKWTSLYEKKQQMTVAELDLANIGDDYELRIAHQFINPFTNQALNPIKPLAVCSNYPSGSSDKYCYPVPNQFGNIARYAAYSGAVYAINGPYFDYYQDCSPGVTSLIKINGAKVSEPDIRSYMNNGAIAWSAGSSPVGKLFDMEDDKRDGYTAYKTSIDNWSSTYTYAISGTVLAFKKKDDAYNPSQGTYYKNSFKMPTYCHPVNKASYDQSIATTDKNSLAYNKGMYYPWDANLVDGKPKLTKTDALETATNYQVALWADTDGKSIRDMWCPQIEGSAPNASFPDTRDVKVGPKPGRLPHILWLHRIR